MSDCVLLWFKNDLRLTDNEAFQKALLSDKPVLPVFCFDPGLYDKLDLGFRKAGINRLRFSTECVADIREQLMALGGNLKMVVGTPETQIPKLVELHNCTRIFAEREYAPEELAMVARLRKKLPDTCTLDLSWGKTLYHIDDIPYTIEDIPLTSKAYRINTTKNTKVRQTIDRPEKGHFLKLEEWGDFPEPSEFDLKVDVDDIHRPYLPGGETQALKRLQEYSFGTEQLTG